MVSYMTANDDYSWADDLKDRMDDYAFRGETFDPDPTPAHGIPRPATELTAAADRAAMDAAFAARVAEAADARDVS